MFESIFTFLAFVFIIFLFALQWVIPYIDFSRFSKKQKPTEPSPSKQTKEQISNTDPPPPPKETKNIVTPVQPISFHSPPPTEQPELRCDSFGNIKPNASEPPKNSKIPVLIYGTILVAFLIGIVVLIITQIETPEPPEPHVHEYVNGQCSCLSFDESYCEPIYQEILDIMETMNTPIEDLVTIQSKLELLPIEYMGVKSITAQCYTLHNLCTTIRSESMTSEPDYQKIQTSLFTFFDKKNNGNYSLWNISSIVNSFFDVNLYSNETIIWSLLYGYWSSSSGYYISYDGKYVSTNLPNQLSHLSSYYLPARGREIYVSESANGLGTNAFRIFNIKNHRITIYCYSTGKSYVLTLEDPP